MKESDTPFYLTGGTALSRAYYNHRYSDDLDFFMTKNQDFSKYADKVIEKLKMNGFYWDNDTDFIKTPDFYSLSMSHKDYPTQLKIDFVNDLPVHFGQIIETDLFYRTDSIRNILSNKITASVRYAVKDMVDIHQICLHEKFNWKEVFDEVNQKEIGLDPEMVADIIQGTPKSQFDTIKWISKPNWEQFSKDLTRIASDMVVLTDNKLCLKVENNLITKTRIDFDIER